MMLAWEDLDSDGPDALRVALHDRFIRVVSVETSDKGDMFGVCVPIVERPEVSAGFFRTGAITGYVVLDLEPGYFISGEVILASWIARVMLPYVVDDEFIAVLPLLEEGDNPLEVSRLFPGGEAYSRSPARPVAGDEDIVCAWDIIPEEDSPIGLVRSKERSVSGVSGSEGTCEK